MENKLPIQPTLNLGIVGHVDHGKTTLTKLLSGKWTDTHSEEKKRGITIKLGYTNFNIYTNKDKTKFSPIEDKDINLPLKKISIVDAPGHESFMATMISGAAVMDCALLIVAANENCPQPQTIEHLKTLEISGITKVIVIQNKIDLVTKEEAIENYNQIKEFLKTTIAKDSPIIPMSAEYGANLSDLLGYISSYMQDTKKEDSKIPLMNLVRSFDINKPGDDYTKLKGGVLGGSIKQGEFEKNQEIEIKPGISFMKEGKTMYKPIYAKIENLMSNKDKLEKARTGGSIAIMTKLDPSITKTDSLVGQMVGLKGQLPEPQTQIKIKPYLFDDVITSTTNYNVKDLYLNESLMLIINSLTTVGLITKTNSKESIIKLRRPVMAFEGDRAVIFRRFEKNKWKIIGHGIINL